MIYKILLACSGGFSTSILVHAMNVAARAKGVEIEILAVGEDNISDHLDADILLLAPQIEHKLEPLSESLQIPVCVVNMKDYGTMNGDKVLTETLEKIKTY